MRRRLLSRENEVLAAAVVVSLAAAIFVSRSGLPHKWFTAIFGTAVPFAVALVTYRTRWRRWSFWLSYLCCLALHSAGVFLLFGYGLPGDRNTGLLIWFPIVFVESFILIFAIAMIERRVFRNREVIELA